MFNYERPHEGLNNKTPGSIYQPTSMMLPRALIGYVYPKGFVIRRVNSSGEISWHKSRVFVGQALRFEDLGFELVAEDFYSIRQAKTFLRRVPSIRTSFVMERLESSKSTPSG